MKCMKKKKDYLQPSICAYVIEPVVMTSNSGGNNVKIKFSENGENGSTSLQSTNANSEGLSRDDESIWED